MSAPSSSSPAAASSSSSTAPVRKRPRDDDERGEDDDESQRRPPAQPAAAPRRVYLHRHALESIFACLDLSGLATVMAVSRDWQAAVGSMRSIDASLDNATSAKLSWLDFSPLRHHITGISLKFEEPLTMDRVTLLQWRMPHLLRLSCRTLQLPKDSPAPRWPSRLQALNLSDVPSDLTESTQLLRTIGQLSQLSKLVLSLRFYRALSFTPLAALPLLRHLTLYFVDPESGVSTCPLLSEAQIDELRTLSDLDTFDMKIRPVEAVRLFRLPHQLRWRSAPGCMIPDNAVCALLPGLSCLTELSISPTRCTHFDFLPRIQNLTTLKVGLVGNHPTAGNATRSLVAALQHCPRITSLKMYAHGLALTSEQLATCLAAMPALSALDMMHASLSSLSFLSVPSLALSLRKLSLVGLPQEPQPKMNDLCHILGLRSLERLTLFNALAQPLDEATSAALQPPSTLLPNLVSVEYQHRKVDAEGNVINSDDEADDEEDEEDDEGDEDLEDDDEHEDLDFEDE